MGCHVAFLMVAGMNFPSLHVCISPETLAGNNCLSVLPCLALHFVAAAAAAATGFILGFVCGILGVTGTGIGVNWDPNDVSGSFASGANWAWYGNNYDWRPFLAALLCSTVPMLLWCTGVYVLRKRFGVRGPGISGLVMRIPGAKYVTATPNWLPESRIGAHDLPRMAGDKAGLAASKDTLPVGTTAV